MKITMLGVGNGFSTGVYDNNALIEYNGQCCMIDCGTSAWISLAKMQRSRAEINSIFLTHLHFDHSGGVESAALYGKYVSNTKTKLIVPKPIRDRLWENVLKGTIENKAEKLTALEDYFEVAAPEENEEFFLCDSLPAYWFKTKHIAGKFSCGLVVDNRLLYTSDMVADLELIAELESRGIEYIFHDCQLQNALVHADFSRLLTYPKHLRAKMYLMHHGLSGETDAPPSNEMTFLFQHRPMEI